VTLPPGRRPSHPVGVTLASNLRGDFDVAAGYELIRIDPPPAGGWGGLELYVAADTPADDAIAFYRNLRAGKGDSYTFTRMATINGKRQYPSGSEPAAGATGRLRLTRRGREVTLWAAEGSAEYREVRRYDFGVADLKVVRFAAHPGDNATGVDLRITDVRIEDGPVSPDSGPVAAAPPRPFRAAGLPALLGYGLTATLSLAGVWAVVRRRRRPVARAAAPRTVTFVCAGCGKQLVVKAEWAGKKGRCVKCRREMVVPVRTPADDSEANA
jgi:hypothetical protein